MKKLLFLTIVCLLAILLIAPIAMAKDVQIDVAWDKNTEPDMARYNIYHRVEGQGYNYTVPIKTTQHTATTPDPVTETIPLNGVPDNAVTKNYFVVQAEDSSGNKSGDSSEVWASYDLRVPPNPVITAGVYNDTTQTVDLSWDQASPEIVSKWKVFNSTVSGGPYAEIGELVNDGTPEHTMSWNIPGDGNYFFVVVGFRDGSQSLNTEGAELTVIDAANTGDSNQMAVAVQVHPSRVHNFKVKIRVQ